MPLALNLPGGGKKVVSAVEITPEGGETIFWGKGRCFTCHSLGDQGSAVRCPNLGQFGEKFPLPIGVRAVETTTASRMGVSFGSLQIRERLAFAGEAGKQRRGRELLAVGGV